MSNGKTWGHDQLERKECRSIYLTGKHWNDLYKMGNGSPTKAIRKMLEEKGLGDESSMDTEE